MLEADFSRTNFVDRTLLSKSSLEWQFTGESNEDEEGLSVAVG